MLTFFLKKTNFCYICKPFSGTIKIYPEEPLGILVEQNTKPGGVAQMVRA
jgi:hypothetical protein